MMKNILVVALALAIPSVAFSAERLSLGQARSVTGISETGFTVVSVGDKRTSVSVESDCAVKGADTVVFTRGGGNRTVRLVDAPFSHTYPAYDAGGVRKGDSVVLLNSQTGDASRCRITAF